MRKIWFFTTLILMNINIKAQKENVIYSTDPYIIAKCLEGGGGCETEYKYLIKFNKDSIELENVIIPQCFPKELEDSYIKQRYIKKYKILSNDGNSIVVEKECYFNKFYINQENIVGVDIYSTKHNFTEKKE